MQVPPEAEVAPPATGGGLFRAMLQKVEFLLSTQATFVNEAVAHCLILFVLFEHFFYTVSKSWSGGTACRARERGGQLPRVHELSRALLQSYVEATGTESPDPGPFNPDDPNWTFKAIFPQIEFALVSCPG